MTLNNPHAMEGLFAKSRGVLNEARVWKGFTDEPRSSVPLENFLIGKTCIETAQNYAQHVNKTIEENYKALGLSASDAPTVAYVDPYLADDDHARVLLYDVAHDREFIAFQDIFMQVQTSAKAVEIGWPRKFIKDGSLIDLAEYVATNTGGGPSWATTQIDRDGRADPPVRQPALEHGCIVDQRHLPIDIRQGARPPLPHWVLPVGWAR
jgi:hypothetical protein